MKDVISGTPLTAVSAEESAAVDGGLTPLPWPTPTPKPLPLPWPPFPGPWPPLPGPWPPIPVPGPDPCLSCPLPIDGIGSGIILF